MKQAFYQRNNYAAFYMRLSKEDSGSGESVSIENQRKILNRYMNEKGFDFYGEYIDDGYSGTTLERPALKRLTEDISKGEIGVVLTKDFSRLGRNAGRTLNLIDDFFTRNKVRFIAVTDGIDTINEDSHTIWMTPFISAITEAYAADISRKINASLNAKVLNGEFIGAFPPFGYKKDKKNKNQIIPDEESAQIVKTIFSLAKEGIKTSEIAEALNEKLLPTPSKYRADKYGYTMKIKSEWTNNMVKKILCNEIYIGTMVQGKTHKPNFKAKYTAYIPKEKWVKVENTHTALIDKETWMLVRKTAKKRQNTNGNGFENVFSGFVKCADCGKSMSTSISGSKVKTVNLVCGGYKLYGKKACTDHRINYGDLYNIVLNHINSLIYPEKITKIDYSILSNFISNIDIHQAVYENKSKKHRIDIYFKFKIKP